MGKVTCLVRGCFSQSGEGMSLFRLPTDRERRTAWLLACNRDDLLKKHVGLSHYKICDLHFEDKFKTLATTRKHLMPHAIPTLFPNFKRKSGDVRFFKKIVEHAGADLRSVTTLQKDVSMAQKLSTPGSTFGNRLMEVNEDYVDYPELIFVKEEYEDESELESDPLKFEVEPQKDFHNAPSSVFTDHDYCAIKVKEEPDISISESTIQWVGVKCENVDDQNEASHSQQTENQSEKANLESLQEIKVESHEELYKTQKSSVFTDHDYCVVTVPSNIIINNNEEGLPSGYVPTTSRIKMKSSGFDDYNQPCSSRETRSNKRPNQGFTNKNIKKKKRYSCPICRESYPSMKSRWPDFSGHFGNHCIPCELCGKLFIEKNEFLCHYEHSVKSCTKLTIFKCHICSKQFNQKYNLTKHLRSHPGKETFKCETCFKGFTHKSNLSVHLKSHIGEKICPNQLVQKNRLAHHSRTHTSETFKCGICSKEFSQKQNLIQHLRTHTGEKPYKCKFYFKQFSIKSNLNSHLRIHAGQKLFKCQICSKEFIRKCVLINHLRCHTGEKPFKCEICHKQFTNKNTLTVHLRIHTGEKPYNCEFCFKQFINKYGLNVHIRSHTGEKPFKCHICSTQFARKPVQEYHFRVHR